MRGSILLFLLVLWKQDSVHSIRLIELRVPGHAAAGGEALLGCQFDLEGDLLYSVKWYKDGREFYRYMPRGDNHTLRFLRPGVTVDLRRSSSDVVTLVNLKSESAGIYRCEVSGEAPLFNTAADEKYITIHILPKGGPRITGLRYQYNIGDRVVANCSSPGSRPQAQLKWLVNNRPVHNAHLRGPWLRAAENPPDTVDVTLGLNFMVLPGHYKSGVMEVKCQSTIAPLYQREKAYILAMPDPNEETTNRESEIDPGAESPDTMDLSDKQIQEDIIDSFRELANTIHLELPALNPPVAVEDTTTSEPEPQDSDVQSSSKSVSFSFVLLTLLLQVILL